MRRVRWATCLWPGLTQVWHEGSIAGLCLAVTFTLLFNLALLVTLAWTEAVAPGFRVVLWSAVAGWWSIAAVASYYWTVTHAPHEPDGRTDQHYQLAVAEYLKRNWLRAETLFEQLLAHNPHDVDVQIMLASLLRRTGRLDEAGERLTRIRRLDGWRKWELEVGREETQLARLLSDTKHETQPNDEPNDAAHLSQAA